MSCNYQQSFAKRNLEIPTVQTTSYVKHTFIFTALRAWNDIQKEMEVVMLNIFLLGKIKPLLLEFNLNMSKIILYSMLPLKWSIKVGHLLGHCQ